jgi:hypothetical protein
MPPNSTDDLYPAIGWAMFAAERMVQRFLMFPRYGWLLGTNCL